MNQKPSEALEMLAEKFPELDAEQLLTLVAELITFYLKLLPANERDKMTPTEKWESFLRFLIGRVTHENRLESC